MKRPLFNSHLTTSVNLVSMDFLNHPKYYPSEKDEYFPQSERVVLNTLLFGDRIILPEVCRRIGL